MSAKMNAYLFRALVDGAETHNNYMGGLKHYHNYKHAKNVVNVMGKICEASNTVFTQALHLAGLYHDVIYIPGAAGGNEHCSAAFLKSIFNVVRIRDSEDDFDNERVIQSACDLILQTTVENHLSASQKSGHLAILLDADLSSLGIDYSLFVMNQRDIFKENFGFTEKDLQKHKDFLKQFLNVRQFIYHTESARMMYENRARENIERYIREAKLDYVKP